MKTKNLLALAIACVFLVSSVAVPAFAIQPPIDTSTYWVGTIGQPRRLDPARAYDTASGEVIFNVYEPLIFFSDKKVLGTDLSINVSQQYSDLSMFEPVLATSLPTVVYNETTHATSLIFEIKQNIPFQPWIAANGSVICEYMTVYDVEYSFKRMLVQDMIGAPSWMIALPFTGHMFFSELDADPDTNTIEPVGVDGAGERLVRDLINNAIQVVDATHIRFNMLPDKTWPTVALYQIFSQTWGSIVCKDFAIEHGCWDGSFADGWSTKYRMMPSYLYSPLDRYYSPYSKYTSGDHDVPAMCGTGPYISRKAGSTYGNKADWDTATLTWRAKAWENYPGVATAWQTYRGGWNAAGTDKHSIRNIVVMGVAEWPTRKMMFLKGDFDSVAVPRANMWDLLQTGQQYTPLAGIRLYYNMPALSNDAMFYCFTVDPTSPYVPKVGGTPTPNLFSNVHMRKAFNYALNFTTYLRDAWWSEAIQQASWWVDGLQPAAAKNTTLVPYTYDPAQMQAELQAAGVWDSGFEVTILYNLGNDQRKIAAEMIRDAFRALGTKYVVNVVGVDWPVILDYMEVFYMPVYYIGWLADFAYPDNFARPFMHSSGDFSYYQNYSDPHVDYLIDHAITETNETKAIEMYQELQYIYWRDAVSLPIMQAVGRRWERDWVRGYYYNQLYPGLFFYDLWKAPAGTLQNVDVSVTHSITGVVYKYNVTQVWHAESRVGYRGPGQTPGTYQAWITNWTISASRDDTNGNVALLYVAVGLKTNDTYQDAGYLVLSPGGHDSINLKWYDDGVTLSISEGLYVVGGEASIITGSGGIYATDTNPANNYILWGNVESKALVGDINGDGIVDIYDALKLASAFGKKSTEKGYNADADLKYDKVIDIFDALKLAGNFGKFVSAVYP